MTTTIPEQAFDLALESLMDDEATCCADGNPATTQHRHGTCQVLICANHAKFARTNRDAALADHGLLLCGACRTQIEAPELTLTEI